MREAIFNQFFLEESFVDTEKEGFDEFEETIEESSMEPSMIKFKDPFLSQSEVLKYECTQLIEEPDNRNSLI